MTESAPFRPARLGLGALYALVGHAIVIAAAFIAGILVRAATTAGMRDLAAIASTGIVGEAILGLVCLIWGSRLFGRDDRERGLGLVSGWLAGLAILVLIFRSST